MEYKEGPDGIPKWIELSNEEFNNLVEYVNCNFWKWNLDVSRWILANQRLEDTTFASLYPSKRLAYFSRKEDAMLFKLRWVQ